MSFRIFYWFFLGLARIFHGKPIPTCGRAMPTALDLNFDWGGMKHTATASKSFIRLVSMVLALRLTTIYHEIFGLAAFSSLLLIRIAAATKILSEDFYFFDGIDGVGRIGWRKK